MTNKQHYIIESVLHKMILEQDDRETANANVDAAESGFTPAEERFIGKFDAYGTQHIGLIYSLSAIGIREFIARSGIELNVTPGILLNLYKNGIIKFVPYTGWGRDNSYTVELQLSLDDVKGLGEKDKEKASTAPAGGGGGGDMGGGPPPPGPEVAWVVKYGDILKESIKITKQVLTETKSKKQKQDNFIDKTRVYKNLPARYLQDMERIIKAMSSKAKTSVDKAKIIADVLDILQLKMKLTPKQIERSFEYHKNQKRLQKYLDSK
jgi:hypothetical protein